MAMALITNAFVLTDLWESHAKVKESIISLKHAKKNTLFIMGFKAFFFRN